MSKGTGVDKSTQSICTKTPVKKVAEFLPGNDNLPNVMRSLRSVVTVFVDKEPCDVAGPEEPYFHTVFQHRAGKIAISDFSDRIGVNSER